MSNVEGSNAVLASEPHLVMLIENEVGVRQAVTSLLEEAGFSVSARADGAEGLSALESGLRPDIILIDLKTPRMNGWEFRIVQRRNAAWAAIPTVALSACASPEAEAIDADAYLSRPFSDQALIDTIRRLLDERDLARVDAHLRERERLNSLGMLAAGIAHEVNNPLTFVVGNLDLAIRQIVSARAQTSEVDLARLETRLRGAEDGANRVAEVVRRMAQFARPTKREQTLVDVAELMESSLQLVKNELRHRAQLERVFRPAPPVRANAAQLGQVFLNLLLNAIYALDQRREAGIVRVGVGSDDGEVFVTVTHNGTSLPAHRPARFLAPDSPSSRVVTGVGANLLVSHGYVEELGGSLTVQAGESGDTTFRVTLKGEGPAASIVRDPQAAESSAPRIARPVDGMPKVLVVDDEKLVCELVSVHLAERYVVTTTLRGDEALARLRNGEVFDVIVCDVMMPGMTGIELYQTLLREQPDQAARMLFISGGAFTERTRSFFDRPGVAYLLKPFSGHQLLEAVEGRVAERGQLVPR